MLCFYSTPNTDVSADGEDIANYEDETSEFSGQRKNICQSSTSRTPISSSTASSSTALQFPLRPHRDSLCRPRLRHLAPTPLQFPRRPHLVSLCHPRLRHLAPTPLQFPRRPHRDSLCRPRLRYLAPTPLQFPRRPHRVSLCHPRLRHLAPTPLQFPRWPHRVSLCRPRLRALRMQKMLSHCQLQKRLRFPNRSRQRTYRFVLSKHI